jgi:Kef-type K+ transport system membrane component KefB
VNALPSWLGYLIGGIILGMVAHGAHDLLLFTQLRRDVKWMKAVMRDKGMTAPNGDDE